jgi:hypothetical protein
MAPNTALKHTVQEDWLAEAQSGVSAKLEDKIVSYVSSCAGPVLCTCTTIGEVAERAGAVRIDRPMMDAAAREKGPILMAYCLESTRDPSFALLTDALRTAGRQTDINLLCIENLWPLFSEGKLPEFEKAVADDVQKVVSGSGCVVLAQASMAGAASHLECLGIPVLTSPKLAFEATLAKL